MNVSMYHPYYMYSGKKVHRDVSCKSRNHPQTIQTTHKPTKSPTYQPHHLQTTHKPVKCWTNHPLISQNYIRLSLKSFFMIRCQFRSHEPHYLPPQEIRPFYLPFARKKVGVSFYIPARFRILLSPLHNYLPFLIADYNPNHKLLTQLRSL